MRQHTSFFAFISTTFGFFVVTLMKQWIKARKTYIKSGIRIRYLKYCLRNDIVPQHLQRFCNYAPAFSHYYSKKKFRLLTSNFITRLIKIELNDAHRTINQSQRQIFHLVKCISQNIPVYICSEFFRTQDVGLRKFFLRENANLDKKLEWLFRKHNLSKIKDIKPIHYVYNKNGTVASTSLVTDHINNLNTFEVHIEPSMFPSTAKSSLNHIKDRWFINLTSTTIPDKVQCLLQLGDNFSLPVSNIKKTVIEFIKSTEVNTRGLHIDKKLSLRNRSIPIINNLLSFSPKFPLYSEISNLVKATKTFMNNNPNIIFTRADKGNSTVALEKDSYTHKITDMLSDTNTYTKTNKDPTKKLTRQISDTITRWKNKKYISEDEYKRLLCTDGILPRAYGVPKIHKTGYPFRIIISSIDSPTYALAFFLHKIISVSIPKPNSNIDNSFELIKKLDGTHVNNDYVLISLDVTSLFTNIPTDLVLESISNRWSHISENCNIPESEFMTAVKLILDSTYFCFDNVIYKQNFGSPMGSPFSPIAADMVMQDLESRVLRQITFEVPFYFRYVDDIALAVPFYAIDTILDLFNSYHPRLQFTIEVGGDKLNFLDVTIIKNENTLEFDWFHKPTFSGRYLNYLSQHPANQKRGTIIGMVDRAFLLSHPKFHAKNIKFIIDVLLQNDYPITFIFNTINDRIKFLLNKCTRIQDESTPTTEEERCSWFTVPYVSGVSEEFKRVVQDLNVKLSFYSLNKLNKFIKVQKDILPTLSKKNVVYKISCKNCDASYVGQTKRQLKTRISEHRNHINRNTTTHSVITEHRVKLDHDFNWENVEILDNERFLSKRLVSEMTHIKLQKNGINLQSDTEFLNHAYTTVLSKL